ncbi:helix-turn-helix transcriptional regulator [Zavarzinia sp.]|uniref:helix-turn-helix transcriptional regulator n=1 Tax=Zavarzinia sp. TaxID=2027920 RepID=UPI003BB6B2CC
MVARLKDLSQLPGWPRMLSRDQAAAYVGVSTGTFAREVGAGFWPAPLERGRRQTWDRAAIDRLLDQRAGLTQDGPAASGGDGSWDDVV